MSGEVPSFIEIPLKLPCFMLERERGKNSTSPKVTLCTACRISSVAKKKSNKKEQKEIEIIQYSIATKLVFCITFILLVISLVTTRPETTHIVPKVQESQGHSILRPTARLQPKETFPENPRRRFRRQISLRSKRKRGQEEVSFRQARNFAGRTV